MIGKPGSRLVGKALLFVVTVLATSVATQASATTCKHESAASNYECIKPQWSPWLYDNQGHSRGPTNYPARDTLAEAVQNALTEISEASEFCYFNYQVNDIPWLSIHSNLGISDQERLRGYLTGTAYFGPTCAFGLVQAVEISRIRNIFCPTSWFVGWAADNTALCFRDKDTPKCASGNCNGLANPNAAGPRESNDPAWIGGDLNVHTLEKFENEVDWTSGGNHPLVLRRQYMSAGFPKLPKAPIVNEGLGNYWRLSFHATLESFSSATATTKVAQRWDSSRLYFYRNGSAWTGRPEQIGALSDIVVGGTVSGYRLQVSDDSLEEYDLLGRLVAVVARDGWRQDLTYNGSGLLSSVVDSLGRQLSFTYTPSGWLQSVLTPDGLIQYQFDSKERLASVIYSGGATRQYRYMEAGYIASQSYSGLLTGVIDENGSRFSSARYDSGGRAWQIDKGLGVNRYTVNWTGGTNVTDPIGTTRLYNKTPIKGVWYTTGLSQACPSCGSKANSSAIAYDSVGNVLSRTTFTNKKTCYAYDSARNLETARLEGATTAETCTAVIATPPNRPDVRKVTTTWHATWRVPATIVEPAPGGTRTTSFTYDTSGNLKQKTITAPKNDGTATTITRTWKWTYGTLGRVLTATDPNNKITTTAYHSDTDPDLGKRGQVATITNPLSHVTQFTSYDAGNRLTSMTDPNGVVTTMAYDGRGRLTSRTVASETTTYTYDLAGQLTDVEMPDGATVSYVYDTAHRLTEVHDGLGNKIVYTLDGMGNRTAEQAFDPLGTLARTRTRIYDSLNRLAQEVGAQSQATVMTYDGNGNRLTSTDPLNHTTTTTYDALNRLLTATDPGNGVTQYAYDPSGNLTAVTDPRSLVTSYAYDGLNNQVRQVSPDTGTTNRTFDAAGNLKTSTDARGAVATYTYDGLNRVTRVVYTQTGFTTETHTYTFDGVGVPNAKGRLTQLVDPSGTTKWTYTPHGRVASRQQVAGSVTLTQSYTWNAGRLTGITTPSGQSIGYTYTNGRISGVTLNGSPLIGSGEYEPFGPVAVWQWSNGHTSYRDHDNDGRLVGWEYRNGASIIRRDLTWDNANRITAIVDPFDAANSHTYGYDTLDRLTTAQSAAPIPTTRQYVYDAIGNRQNATVDGALTNYGYSPSSNQLLTLTGATSRNYTYDAVGNPVQIDGRTSTYNLANRLTKLADGAVTVATYKLNGLGQRVAKTIGATITRYFYDEQGRLVGEYASNGALIQETVWLDDLPVVTLRPTGNGAPTPVAVYYVHADHLGTPRAITIPIDDDLVWRWENADPFGNNAADPNPSGLGNLAYSLRFPGQQHDAEEGTHYNYFRDYDSQIGRYLQSDRLGLKGGLNTFVYSDSRPGDRIDPTGEMVWFCLRGMGWKLPVGNHGYFFDDKTGRCCGDPGPNGRNPLSKKCDERGPGKGGDHCFPVSHIDEIGNKLLECCNQKTNDKFYFPTIYDCQNVAFDCAKEVGTPLPDTPSESRWRSCSSCWAQ